MSQPTDLDQLAEHYFGYVCTLEGFPNYPRIWCFPEYTGDPSYGGPTAYRDKFVSEALRLYNVTLIMVPCPDCYAAGWQEEWTPPPPEPPPEPPTREGTVIAAFLPTLFIPFLRTLRNRVFSEAMHGRLHPII